MTQMTHLYYKRERSPTQDSCMTSRDTSGTGRGISSLYFSCQVFCTLEFYSHHLSVEDDIPLQSSLNMNSSNPTFNIEVTTEGCYTIVKNILPVVVLRTRRSGWSRGVQMSFPQYIHHVTASVSVQTSPWSDINMDIVRTDTLLRTILSVILLSPLCSCYGTGPVARGVLGRGKVVPHVEASDVSQ